MVNMVPNQNGYFDGIDEMNWIADCWEAPTTVIVRVYTINPINGVYVCVCGGGAYWSETHNNNSMSTGHTCMHVHEHTHKPDKK